MSFFQPQWEWRTQPPYPEERAQGPAHHGGHAKKWPIIIGALVLAFILASVGKGIYTEWLWFDSLGFGKVYATILITKVELFFLGALVFLTLLIPNLLIAQHLSPKRDFILLGGMTIVRRVLKIGIWVATAILAVIFASSAMGKWQDFLRFFHAASFNTNDPLLSRDIGFFVFNLPIYRFLQGWGIAALIVILIATALIYAIKLGFRGSAFTPAIKAHLSGLGAAVFLFIAWSYRLDIFDLVYSSRGVVFGASYTDVHAQWPALNILFVVAILCAVLLLLVNIFRRGMKLPLLCIGVWIASIIVVGAIYPAIVQKFQVQPNELAKEKPYIEYNIRMTQMAFGLDKIREEDFPTQPAPTREEIENNAATMSNIRLWDYRPLKDTYNQIQTIRLYYDFHDIDVDRYRIDGEYRQVLLGARELSPEKLTSQAQTWTNQRLQFTHGYGLSLSPVNEVSEEGLPRLWIKDIPPEGKIKIEEPGIYYGEKTTDYVIVDTKAKEFDYPKGDANVYTKYKGKGGVKLSSFTRKLLYAWQFGDINLLLSGEITPESKVLYYRNIRERVNHLAPFLLLDGDPYMVIADGKMLWIQDAYTTTDRYPYSQPFRGEFNYIRNSVKAVISAYDGSVSFYVADPTDPIINTYADIFPTLFTPIDQMPSSLRAHLRYPQGLFTVQSEMYQTYHMRDARVFYNKEDLWSFPKETYAGGEQVVEPYYVIMQLPEEGSEEFLLMRPFTPTLKDNMISWLAARCDGENYGKLVVYKFPKEKLIYGPRQIEARIDQDTTISSQLTLWSQRGSRVIRGNLLVIPIGKSILYVEPVYLQAEKGQLPELKRVVVASGNRIAMEPTLNESLAAIYGGAPAPAPPAITPPTPTQPATTDIARLVQEAQEHYLKALEYLRAGYGEEIKKLEETLNQLAELTAGTD
jgi:hypothetical protein